MSDAEIPRPRITPGELPKVRNANAVTSIKGAIGHLTIAEVAFESSNQEQHATVAGALLEEIKKLLNQVQK